MVIGGGAGISVYVIEPLAVTRAALASLLEEAGLQVMARGADAAECMVDSRIGEVAVVLTGPGVAGGSPDWLRRALDTNPRLKVVILANPDFLESAVNLISVGASGCVLTSDSPESLCEALRAAYRGEMALSGDVARRLLNLHELARRTPAGDTLSERERELLALLADGLTNKEIAQSLYLSVRTVEAHLHSIYAKLGVRSRLEAVLQTHSSSLAIPSRTPPERVGVNT
ncbi:MAG: response regulator transcription factor [Chloroflexota bacterium]